MSSSSDDGDEDFVLYRQRAEWNDVKPLPQVDGTPIDQPIVAISYSEKFKDVYDYFRAVLAANELSERSLELTKDAIKLNPACYTVWEFRRKILKHLNKDLRRELLFTSEAIEENQKNYQVWHHRLVLVKWLDDPQGELDFVGRMLRLDTKNYHAWQYRQWLIRRFNLFESEMNYVNELLDDDLRNNSAWNQRYFVVQYTTGFTPEVIEKELQFCVQAILQLKKNESAWNYLRGILAYCEEGLLDKKAYGFAEELYKRNCRSPYLLSYLVDALSQKLEKNYSSEDLERISVLCKDLAQKHDVMRERYWSYIEEDIKSKFKANEPIANVQ